MARRTYGSGTVQEAAQRLFDAGVHPAQQVLDCAGCCTDEDCPCTKVCDEGNGCDRHQAEAYAAFKAENGLNGHRPSPSAYATCTDCEQAPADEHDGSELCTSCRAEARMDYADSMRDEL